MAKSIEEKVEEIAKTQLSNLKRYTKTEKINTEIDNALAKAASKSGGKGGNYPDIKLLVKLPHSLKTIPVMIEVKGTKGDLVKKNADGEIDNYSEKGEPQYKHIKKYAVNGAVHYAEAIIKYSHSYKNVIAIGFNGWQTDKNSEVETEMEVYYISQENSLIPKKIGTYSDLSFLQDKFLAELEENINNIQLTEQEKENQTRNFEAQIETVLQRLNQQMHDNLNIKAESRVQLVCGMIMASLGIENIIQPLEIDELKGNLGNNSHDGMIVLNKIKDFLDNKKLPTEKYDVISTQFYQILQDKNYYTPRDGESPIKTVFIGVKEDVMPIFLSAKHLDFTGKLFNTLNSWIPLRPGDDKNDVVLTPRYVTELMAKLAQVNKDSYVWDYTAGSGGFLVSAMKLMIEDAQNSIHSQIELNQKISHIKLFQLLGVEIRPEIYMLAVLNMILMGDGSSHILNADSLNYSGNYEQQIENEKDQPFPADVFLLNPPYSASGKGFVFVAKALKRMKHGRAAILIQENAGSGNGLPYTQDILKKNTLLASIKMADIFYGKAGVQTAIYLFEVGRPHDVRKKVKFIDFSNDGYARQNRKKSSLHVNLRNSGDALGRYQEIVDIVLGNEQATHYFDNCIIEDTISLEGNDWTYLQHKQTDTTPTEQDFMNTVKDYLAWKVAQVLKAEDSDNANF